MSPAMKDQVQPVVKDAAPEDGDTGTIRIVGRPHKVTMVVAMASVLATLVIAGVTMIRTGGVNAGRITALEEKSDTFYTVQETIRDDIGRLKTQQAVTQTTVEAIQQQQAEDRTHFDTRMNQLFEAVRRRLSQ